MNTKELYDRYKTKMQKIADVKFSAAVLQWDQETYLPPKGNAFRGRQLATLSELAHIQLTSDEMRALLNELNGKDGLSDKEKRNVELSLEDHNKAKLFSPRFVREMSEAVNKSFHAWINARKKNDFDLFIPDLENIVRLKKQEADIRGYSNHPYDALMDEYDKGLTVAKTDELFIDLKPQLSSLLNKISNVQQMDDSFLKQSFDKNKQWDLGIELLKRIHFDFEAGRQDVSEHPFTTNFNNQDVRLTTRIDENDLSNMVWSCIHEGGHGLYEQGLSGDQYGLPLGEYCSLSIHESQSRLWENCVGRSLPFWEKNYSLIQEIFPQQLKNVSVNNFYKAINKVQPSLIRTEADELSYHFHVMIRYELEKQLIEGSISVKDIRSYWNEQYKIQLGVIVPDDLNGALQDVHWSHGSFGYFATYSIGSLYAAQLYAAIEAHNGSKIHTGEDTSIILNWLRQHIHNHGRYYNSGQLCQSATGEMLNCRYFIDYATKKFSEIYLP